MIDQETRLAQLVTVIDGTPHDGLEGAVAELPGGIETALTDLFELLASEFNPMKAKGKRGVFQFEIASASGAVHRHFVHVEDHRCVVGVGQRPAPDITIGISLPDMLLMGVGKLPGAKAFLTGKLKLRGNPLFGTKLGEWFDHPPV